MKKKNTKWIINKLFLQKLFIKKSKINLYLETLIQLENRAQMLCSSSNDMMEGIQAFLEKREPKYPLK